MFDELRNKKDSAEHQTKEFQQKLGKGTETVEERITHLERDNDKLDITIESKTQDLERK